MEGELGEGREVGKTLDHCIEEASVAEVEEAQRSPQGVGNRLQRPRQALVGQLSEKARVQATGNPSGGGRRAQVGAIDSILFDHGHVHF